MGELFLICELQKIAMVLPVICDQLTGALVLFFCDQLMKTVTILFSLKTRCENWSLICELQNISMVLLVICDQLRGAPFSSFVSCR
jgi:hypothetical protein